MAQKTPRQEYNNPNLLKIKRPLRHKGFYTLLLTALFGMFIFVTYYAVQQVQVYQSSAKECPKGKHLDDKGKCVPNKGDGGGKTCSKDEHLNDKGKCVPNKGDGEGKECDPGYHKNKDGICVCNKTNTNPECTTTECEPGFALDDSGECVAAACDDLSKTECTTNEDCYWFAGGFCGASCITHTDEASCTAGSCGWNSELQCCGGDPPCVSGDGEDGGGDEDGTGAVGTAVFDLSLSFQGIIATPLSGETTMDVLVTLAGGELVEPVSQTTTFAVDNNGVWTGEASFDNVVSSEGYKLLVKGPKHMQKKVCETTPTESRPGTYACGDGNITVSVTGTNTADFSGIRLLVGDLAPQDGVVDAYDVSLIRNNFCTTENPNICKDPKLLSEADLNLDGIIDSQDYSLMIASLSIKYDEK